MFGGKYIVPLTRDEVFSRVSELDLWKHYIRAFKAPYKVFRSELREEDNPSCCVQIWASNGLYKDFKTDETFNILGYIQKLYSCSYTEALNRINTDFSLGLMGKLSNVRPILSPRLEDVSTRAMYKSILVKIRDWSKQDKEYWKDRYGVSTRVLKMYNAYALKHFYLAYQDELIYIKPKSLAYGYWEGEDKWKVYSPFEANKWVGNIPRSTFSGWRQLDPTGEVVIITKALKDVMVYREFNMNAISPQSEAQKIGEEVIQELRRRYNRIIINYDNDETGEKYMKKLSEQYGLEKFKTTETKDISDYREEYGERSTKALIDGIYNES